MFIVIVYITFVVNRTISLKISYYSNIRNQYGTNIKIQIGETQKKVWKYEDIFIIKFAILLGSTVLLYFPYLYVFTFIHEANHALTCIFYGVELIEINITNFGNGYTRFISNIPNSIYCRIVVAGSLGTIIIAILFLIYLFKYANLKIELLSPHYFLTSYIIFKEINYWRNSIIIRNGDAWDFLTCTQWATPAILSLICNFIFFLALFFIIIGFTAKIIKLSNTFFDKIYPNLTFLKK